MKSYRLVLVLLCLLLWTTNNNQVMKVSLIPLTGSEPKVALCTFKEQIKGLQEKSEQYFKEMHEIIPLNGSQMFLKLARSINENNDAVIMPYYPMENLGVMKFVGIYVVGLLFLMLVILQFFLGMTNFTHSTKINFFKKMMAAFGAIGFFLTLSFVAFESFRGLQHTKQVKVGLQQLSCTADLMGNIHKHGDKVYGIFDIPQIFYDFQKIWIRMRTKVAFLMRNYFFNTPQDGKEIYNRLKNINEKNQNAKNDTASKQIQADWQNHMKKYESAVKIFYKKGAVEDFPISWNMYRMSDTYSFMRAHLELVIRVISPVKNWAEKALTSESRQNTVFWLKAIYLTTFLISILGMASVYYFVIPKGKSVTVKKLTAYSVSLIGILLFLVAIYTSLMIPYTAWTCEASRTFFTDPVIFRKHIDQLRLHHGVVPSLEAMGPKWKGKNITEVLRVDSTEYYGKIKEQALAFKQQQAAITKTLDQIIAVFKKYDGGNQDTFNRLDKLRNKQFSAQSFKYYHKTAQVVSELAYQIKDGLFGSFRPQKVTESINIATDSLCTYNFINLYETRQLVGHCAYGLLISIFFLMMTRSFIGLKESDKSLIQEAPSSSVLNLKNNEEYVKEAEPASQPQLQQEQKSQLSAGSENPKQK